MAIRSKEWFYKECLRQVKSYGRFCHLSWSVLEKGIGQSDSTRGHVTQAIGVAQAFLSARPAIVAKIKSADPTRPFNVRADRVLQNALRTWLATRQGIFGKASFGFDYDVFKNIVTATLGGTRMGGGGGDDEFKRVLRLMVEFQ